MRHFKRMAAGVNPAPFLEDISQVDGAWDKQRGRQEKLVVQREALAIPLRGLRKSAQGDRDRCDVHESRWTTGSALYPRARRFLKALAKEREALLGRAKIVKLPPGKRVYAHIDRGDYYTLRDRYHLVLATSPAGSWLKAGDEEVRMQTGELWWFDNKQVHEAANDGETDRIHLIFDMLPRIHEQAVFGTVAQGFAGAGVSDR